MQTKNRGFFSWVMTALIIILLVSVISDFFDKTIETDYSSLVKCINGGMVSQLYIDDTTATAIVGEERIRCEIPSKEVLIAMLLGTLNAPVAALARALNAIAEKQN